MVSRLRQPNADMSIELADGPYSLGIAITGRVTLLPGESFQIRGGRAEFICIETYLVKVERRARFGSAEIEESSNTVIRQYSQPLFTGTEIANLMPQVDDIDFIIPLDAPHTVQGNIADIAWRLKVTVDVARARDISRELDLVVLPAPAERVESDLGPGGSSTPATSQFPECDLDLSLAALRVPMGENVEGVLKVIYKESFSPVVATIELMRLQKAGSSQIENSVESTEFQLSEAATGPVTAGEATELPFSLPVPQCLLATISVHETRVSWRVRATVSSDDGKELEVSQRITVRGAV